MKTQRQWPGQPALLAALLFLLPALRFSQDLLAQASPDNAKAGLQTAASPSLARELAPLRLAIEDLIATCGVRYPRGAAFLNDLDGIQARLQDEVVVQREAARADLARLQREALLANPLVSGQPILFVVRRQYRGDHHNTATFFPAAKREYNDGGFTPGGAIKVIDFARGGQVRTLLDVPPGVARDPEVHFDGRRIIFSLRTNAADSYHVYEMGSDGTGLWPLTAAADVDDLDPLYLPDDSVVFTSTREPKYCMCNRHIMANLFRMDRDGANIHQIGKSTLFEGHGSLLPDGRILYDRWEYVDRNFGDAQSLWTANPDGTSHAVYWGNNTAAPGAVLEARSIPGTERVLCVFGSCHDRPWGALAIIDRSLGLDGLAPVVRTWPADATNLVHQSGWELFDAFTHVRLKYQDPYPLSDKYFLCSRMTGQGEQMGIYLLDVFGNEMLLHTEGPGCFDPMPLAPRPRPPVLTSRRDYENKPGYFYVQDVYRGTHMRGVERGAIKWLRVVESPEKRFWTMPVWGGQGIEGPAMNWHDFNNKRILGTVPVEADGSASFEVPADRFVYFQLLDTNGMMVQSMRSGTMVQSGEQASCVGCHDERRTAPPVSLSRRTGEGRGEGAAQADSVASGASVVVRSGPVPLALQRPPSKMEGWYGPPREFSYRAEVQPVFDKHCLRCHDFGTKAGSILNFAGDRDLVFNVSYNELWRKKFIRVVGAGPPETQPAYSWGSPASKLTATLKRWLADGRLTREEFERVVTWMDLNAPYYPTYACAYPDNLAGRSPLNDGQLARLEQLTRVPLRQLAGHNSNRGPQITFDRPDLSPCLNSFTNKTDPAFQEALAIIRAGHDRLARQPEADAPGFQPCPTDQWREEKYLTRQKTEQRNRESIRHGEKAYDGR
jgi:hypothetical protein